MRERYLRHPPSRRVQQRGRCSDPHGACDRRLAYASLCRRQCGAPGGVRGRWGPRWCLWQDRSGLITWTPPAGGNPQRYLLTFHPGGNDVCDRQCERADNAISAHGESVWGHRRHDSRHGWVWPPQCNRSDLGDVREMAVSYFPYRHDLCRRERSPTRSAARGDRPCLRPEPFRRPIPSPCGRAP